MKTHLLKNCFEQSMLWIALLWSSCCFAQATDDPLHGPVIPELIFKDPILIKGVDGMDGATYLFKNAAEGIDATIQILKRSDSQVIINALDITSIGWDKAFQPQVGIKYGILDAGYCWMEFNLKLYKAGTNTLAKVGKFYATALDIDGDNDDVREFVQFENATSVTYSPLTYLTSDTPLDTNNDGIIDDIENGEENLAGTGFLAQGPLDNAEGIDTVKTAFGALYTFVNKNDIKFIVGAKTQSISLSGLGPAHLDPTPVPGPPVPGSVLSSVYKDDPGLRLNSIWFKSFDLSPVLVVLPVKLKTFTALHDHKDILLQWSIAGIEDLDHFVVERSTDGIHFKEIASVKPKGVHNSPTYSYIDEDNTSASEAVYYRLRIVENSSKFTYSPVCAVKPGTNVQDERLVVVPNPVQDQAHILFPKEWRNKLKKLELYSADGARLQVINAATADQNVQISMNGLCKGFYVIKAIANNQTLFTSIIKN